LKEADLPPYPLRKRSTQRCRLGFFPWLLAALLVAGAGKDSLAAPKKVKLERKFAPGQQQVYQTKVDAQANLQANPPGLLGLLPPLPTRLAATGEDTLKVQSVAPNGVADVENRFDNLTLDTDLLQRTPEAQRAGVQKSLNTFLQKANGQVVTARYNAQGELLATDGEEAMVDSLEPSLREPVRQGLKLLLQQLGGNTLYPDHPVAPGDAWTRNVNVPPTEMLPFTTYSKTDYKYVGNTKYKGVKAAIIDFDLTTLLKPELEQISKEGPLAQMKASGVTVDVQVTGQGKGRALVALDDGRMLQNQSTVQQNLSVMVKAAPSAASQAKPADPLSLNIDAHLALDVESSNK
jgi:hypothetical protein